jgi:glycosyltransferase involved in cell wall biosynthesis
MAEPGLRGAHLVFLGSGDLREALEELAERLGSSERVHFMPPVPPADLLDWIAPADVAAMPILPTSLNNRLSTPNKLFESLAAGVPVVTPDLPARRPIVLGDPAGPLGELCDSTDPASIARAIRAVLERSPEEREALRARCLAAARERWNWEIEGAKLVRLYAELEAEIAGGA